jgi:hypothetical protein
MSTGDAVLVRGFVFGFGFDFGVAFGRWILIFRRRGGSASSSVGKIGARIVSGSTHFERRARLCIGLLALTIVLILVQFVKFVLFRVVQSLLIEKQSIIVLFLSIDCFWVTVLFVSIVLFLSIDCFSIIVVFVSVDCFLT